MKRGSIVALMAMVVVSLPGMTVANDDALTLGDQIVADSKSKTVVNVPEAAPLDSGLTRAKLYSNVEVCTVNPISRNVGGSPPNSLAVRDWFVTGGGAVTGFDLYVMNGKESAPSFSNIDMTFFVDTDEANFGTALLDDDMQPVAFRTLQAPFLNAIPARFDSDGKPVIQRVTVDFIAQTYTVTDMSTGEIVADVANIDREGFTLPGGKIGVQVRMSGEQSICQQFGDKTIGVVMAGGGTGNVDGVHIFDASSGASGCNTANEFDALCRPGWGPRDGDDNLIPCDGGNVCSLDRPYNGIALTLYVGPGEDGTGDNTTSTGNPLDPMSPDGNTCVGEPVSQFGFLGDNPDEGSATSFFDTQPNGAIDLIDWGALQDCFGASGEPGCELFDSTGSDDVTLEDYGDFQACFANINDPVCSEGTPATQFNDIDVYSISVGSGEVLQVQVRAISSPLLGGVGDPLLRIFGSDGVTELARSDDFARNTLDAYTTVTVPSGQSTLFAVVSSDTNSDYDPMDFGTVAALDPDDVGSYEIIVRRTEPDCDSASGTTIVCCNIFGDCAFNPEVEPNESIEDADAVGSVRSRFFTGTLGNGAFGENGQDYDLYKIVFGPVCDEGTNDGNPCTLGVPSSCPGGTCGVVQAFESTRRSLQISIDSEVALGYETVYDTAVALYNSNGELIALGDQSSRPGVDGLDQSRGQLAASIDPPGENGSDGVYYLAVFGTDRNLFEDDCDFLARPGSPTIFNPPHDSQVAGTEEADLRPFVGGRANLPTGRLLGCLTEDEMDMGVEADRFQCYQISISTFSTQLPQQAPIEPTETAGPDGNDSIGSATPIATADRIGNDVEPSIGVLGNGPYGAWQGDVDFYRIDGLSAGQLLTANMADLQLQSENHTVRSFMAFFDQDGFVFERQDYSLERNDTTGVIKDEVSGVISATVPEGVSTAYLMIGIDAGRLDLGENSPFDARRPGTTQSRRFGTNIILARFYNVSVSVIPQIQASPAGGERMFVTTRRGIDGEHTEVFLVNPRNERQSSHPPILEIDPATGAVLQVLDLSEANVSMFHDPPDNPMAISRLNKVTARPLIAYDGETLWVSVEECESATTSNACPSVRRTLNKVDPDETGLDAVETFGLIQGLSSGAILTGMVELNGILYALDDANESIRYWDKGSQANNFNGGRLEDIIPEDGDFDDLFGDISTDGTNILIPCSLTQGPNTTAGICRFEPDVDILMPANSTLTYIDMIADPVSNYRIEPGPRLGGVEYVDGTIIASDLNGPVVSYWDVMSDSVEAYELPREFFIERITVGTPTAP